MSKGEDYCAFQFYLDRLDVIQPLIRDAFAKIEPPLTPAKMKDALRQLAPELLPRYPRIVVERDPNDPNQFNVLFPSWK